jgi:hypothetical protein
MSRHLLAALIAFAFGVSTAYAEQSSQVRPRLKRPVYEKPCEFSNALGSAAAGLAAGFLGSIILVVKDATVGVVVRGGPVYHGKDRILPLVLFTTVTTIASGMIGYYQQINLLDAFR